MNLLSLNSVPLLVTELKDNECFSREEVAFLKSIELAKQYGEDGNYLSKNNHILLNPSLKRVKDVCDKYVHHYIEDVVGIENQFKMFRSWLSMNIKGTKHDVHSHANVMISCVLYFDEYMSSEPMAPIHFGQEGLDSIFRNFRFIFKEKHPNSFNSKTLTIKPKTNTLIIFPAWVKHGTDEATSMVKRYCIGSNYFFEGESGGGYHNINVKVN